MAAPTDPTALLILTRSPLPRATLRRLLEHCPDPDAALRAGPSLWRAVGAEADSVVALQRPDRRRLAADLDWLRQPGHALLGWSDPDYPHLLRDTASPPPVLFVRGDPTLLWWPQVAVVGSRNPSAGGRELAREFALALARHGLVVTSGLAEGIDAAAHEGALVAGRTVAVVGTGTDIAYPRRHRDLMERIAARDVVVGEHPPGTAALATHFPSRNRIIAGLSLGTLVIEAALRSGALITARLATEAGREVFAVPGSIRNPLARGCHRLIRQGAALVESPDELAALLAPIAQALADGLRARLAVAVPTPALASPAAAPDGDDAAARLRSALGHDPVSMDNLTERTGLTVAALSAMLLTMELEGSVAAANGRYSRRA